MRLLARLSGAVAVGAAGSGLLGACVPTTPVPSASAVPSSTATRDPGSPRTTVPVPSSLQRFPDQPPLVHYGEVDRAEIGVAYEYHLYVHCGIRSARFDSRFWRSIVPSDGATVRNDGSQYVAGSMTLIAPALARFEWDGGRADFVPAEVEPPPCS